ncbi:hypothetical protein TNCV_3481071 [Trichonephila clavipes]|nr:hypothetical protein TNCV_3481071 [Trichonephila clavipes]
MCISPSTQRVLSGTVAAVAEWYRYRTVACFVTVVQCLLQDGENSTLVEVRVVNERHALYTEWIEKSGGHGSLVVTDSWLAYHDRAPVPVKTRRVERLMHVKSVNVQSPFVGVEVPAHILSSSLTHYSKKY